jgi:hypothetical protein
MSKTDVRAASGMRAPIPRQRGVAAVEFAIVAVVFFTLVFGIIELCRIMYMYNTLAEVTRSAAAAAAKLDFKNTAALDRVRQRAIFREEPGLLPFGDPVTDQNIRIDYLALARGGGGAITMTPIAATSLPGCPARNRQNCLEDQYGGSCIRLVRVRVCSNSSGACEPVQYQTLIPLVNFNVALPMSSTIVQAETLGYSAGDALCD